MDDAVNANFDESDENEVKVLRRSINSDMHSFVRFVNQTLRRVDIIWLNYQGARVRYITLGPEEFLEVNTFVGHPWIFRDSHSGDKLVVQLKEVYEPIAWSGNDGWPPQRKLVSITIPVYSLKERCLQIIRTLVPRQSIKDLEIPHTLKAELRHEDMAGEEEMREYDPSG